MLLDIRNCIGNHLYNTNAHKNAHQLCKMHKTQAMCVCVWGHLL